MPDEVQGCTIAESLRHPVWLWNLINQICTVFMGLLMTGVARYSNYVRPVRSEVRIPVAVIDFSLHQETRTRSEAHTATCSMVNQGSFSDSKTARP